MKIELLSRITIPIYGALGYAWDYKSVAHLSINGIPFVAYYVDPSWGVVLSSPTGIRIPIVIRFPERPRLYSDDGFVQELKRQLEKDREFKEHIRLNRDSMLKEIAEKVFEMANKH